MRTVLVPILKASAGFAVTTISSAAEELVKVTPKDSGSPRLRYKPLIDSELYPGAVTLTV